jgi:hypothetical protein
MGKIKRVKSNAHSEIDLISQDTENLHIGQVYSVEFGPAEKIFSGHFLGQYWTLNLN